MLELRPYCENCGKSLPPASPEAMICSFECTFCSTCVEKVLEGICPNCGGEFTKRPSRPNSLLEKYPPSSKAIIKVVDMSAHKSRIEKLGQLPPSKR